MSYMNVSMNGELDGKTVCLVQRFFLHIHLQVLRRTT